LIAVGAVLTFAVNATVSGIDINTIGWILMIVGASASCSPCSSGRAGAEWAARGAGRPSWTTARPRT